MSQPQTITIPSMEAIEQMFDAKFQRFADLVEKAVNLKEEKWLKQNEAAKMLGVSQSTLINWKKEGKINTYRVDGAQRYKRSEILNFFNKSNF